MNDLSIIGRSSPLFLKDIENYKKDFKNIISKSSFLVLGGAGSIGKSVVKELFSYNPRILHVIDISENELVELVRDIRSSLGYIKGDFRLLPLDINSLQFDAFINSIEHYDYILNLAALKHVRSEKDPFTLMRLIEVNVLNTKKTLSIAIDKKAKKYFSVSTDKATNPTNLMGASKRVMEKILLIESEKMSISMARFANVAFSNGSLLYGFQKRLIKRQPIACPIDIKRYFITEVEAAHLCLFSTLFGDNRDNYFPKVGKEIVSQSISDIALRFIQSNGFKPIECATEDEARYYSKKSNWDGKWPIYFFQSDTTGEKDLEEFYSSSEKLDINKYYDIGIIKNSPIEDKLYIHEFLKQINSLLYKSDSWSKEKIVKIFNDVLPELNHIEKNKFLDQRM